MSRTTESADARRPPRDEPRQAALRTALVLGAVALAFFVAAFVWLPR